jgi:hypothetical protein
LTSWLSLVLVLAVAVLAEVAVLVDTGLHLELPVGEQAPNHDLLLH